MKDPKELKDSLSFIHTILHDLEGLPESAKQYQANAIKEVEAMEHELEKSLKNG